MPGVEIIGCRACRTKLIQYKLAFLVFLKTGGFSTGEKILERPGKLHLTLNV